MADWTVRLLDAAGVRQAAIVGHSMGGLVALDAAARHPDRVRALGLCGIAAEMPVHPEMLESARAGTAKVRELMVFWGLGRAHQIGGTVSPGLWLTRESLAILDRAASSVIHCDLAACNAYGDAPARAAQVRCPTAFVCGDGDQMTPATKCRPLAAALPGSHMTVLRSCGHFMMVERPDETLAALKAVA
jgi:pimeloyl-ACP methyl ester carboxylesterase